MRKPGPGRFREFLQFDADFVGTKSSQADAELCVMISEILEKVWPSRVRLYNKNIVKKNYRRII